MCFLLSGWRREEKGQKVDEELIPCAPECQCVSDRLEIVPHFPKLGSSCSHFSPSSQTVIVCNILCPDDGLKDGSLGREGVVRRQRDEERGRRTKEGITHPVAEMRKVVGWDLEKWFASF